jgi:dTDP-4-dehydrorhamnose reductase
MKILILGGNGQLGKSLQKIFGNNYEIWISSKKEIDISKFKDTEKSILSFKPNIIINASAYTAVDNAEKNPEKAFLVNHESVNNLSKICFKINCLLIHISTDYVFDGKSNKPYFEDDITNPMSIYGKSKLLGENSIIDSGCKYIIIRTAWLFSEYGSNFLKTMLKLSKNKSLKIVTDQIGCPTYVHDLAKVIFKISSKHDTSRNYKKVYHFCGNESVSWFDFAQTIFEINSRDDNQSKNLKLYKINSSELNYLAPRPKYSILNSQKIYDDYGVVPTKLHIAIQNCIEKIDL